MTPSVRPIPAGYHSITPALTTKNVEQALGFYTRAFGAEERMRFLGPDAKSIVHAEIKIGDSILMLGEEHPDMGCQGPQSLGGTPVSLYLYVEDADQAFPARCQPGQRQTSRWRICSGAIAAGSSRTPPATGGTWQPAKRISRPRKLRNARGYFLLNKWRCRLGNAFEVCQEVNTEGLAAGCPVECHVWQSA